VGAVQEPQGITQDSTITFWAFNSEKRSCGFPAQSLQVKLVAVVCPDKNDATNVAAIKRGNFFPIISFVFKQK
jgi:hypothetical protein